MVKGKKSSAKRGSKNATSISKSQVSRDHSPPVSPETTTVVNQSTTLNKNIAASQLDPEISASSPPSPLHFNETLLSLAIHQARDYINYGIVPDPHQSIKEFFLGSQNATPPSPEPTTLQMTPDQLYVLGQNYFNAGKQHGPKNPLYAKAFECFAAAAERGHTLSTYHCAIFYHQGFSVDRSITKAIELATVAANKGLCNAQNLLGSILLTEGSQANSSISKKQEQGIIWITKAARQGDSHAQLQLAKMYKQGNLLGQNSAVAALWYAKSAKNGHPEAQCELGILYRDGKCFEKDLKAAEFWFIQGAQQNHPKSMFHLGELYYDGISVKQCKSTAHNLWSEAAALDDPSAQAKMAEMYLRGTGGLEQDFVKASMLVHGAFSQGNLDAMKLLGEMQHRRIFVPPPPEEEEDE